jgi:hypothetical protein
VAGARARATTPTAGVDGPTVGVGAKVAVATEAAAATAAEAMAAAGLMAAAAAAAVAAAAAPQAAKATGPPGLARPARTPAMGDALVVRPVASRTECERRGHRAGREASRGCESRRACDVSCT